MLLLAVKASLASASDRVCGEQEDED